jgi:tellurite resistance protein TerC
MVLSRNEKANLGRNGMVHLVSKLLPVIPVFHADRFFIRSENVWVATPLLLVLVCIELSDLLFATDSIPAIFGITLDPFIIYSSNVFAILGLRSLYFVLARALHLFRYLKPALGVVLIFIGTKMLLDHTAWEIGTLPALLAVAGVLAVAIVASIMRPHLRAIRSAPSRGLSHPANSAVSPKQSRA